MHTVEMLEHVLLLAERHGYIVRQEWLGGAGGGACVVGQRKLLFVDLALTAADQLDRAVETLRDDPAIDSGPLSGPLARLFGKTARAA